MIFVEIFFRNLLYIKTKGICKIFSIFLNNCIKIFLKIFTLNNYNKKINSIKIQTLKEQKKLFALNNKIFKNIINFSI